MLKKMDTEQIDLWHPTAISSDAAPPVIPAKHEIGGSMRDHEHEVRPWNNRHGATMDNDGMYHVHREYFSQPSVFAKAPSQQWRRAADMEVAKGVWKPIKERPDRGRKQKQEIPRPAMPEVVNVTSDRFFERLPEYENIYQRPFL